MSKINFVKVEKSFDLAKQQLLIDNLTRLATIAEIGKNPEKKEALKQEAEKIIGHFQEELKQLKKEDSSLFRELHLSEQEELRLLKPFKDYESDDWLLLEALTNRLKMLKKELYGQSKADGQDEQIVAKERKKHVNKRLNIRDGWLPLR